MMPPGAALGLFGSRPTGTEKRAGIGAMSSFDKAVEGLEVAEVEGA